MRRQGRQKNNGSPMGYGQPERPEQPQNDYILDDGAQQIQQFSPEAPSMNRAMPFQGGNRGSGGFRQETQPVRGYSPQEFNQVDQYGQNQFAQRAYSQPPHDTRIANMRNAFATPSQPQEFGSQQMGGDPTRGALAQYGTGNIAGTENFRTGDFMGQLEGFNTGGWGSNERGTNSIKNTFGKIASRYDVSQPGAARAVMADPEFQQIFPMARLVEHPNGDLIDFGDGNGPVDVIRGAVEGGSGAAWQWGADQGSAQFNLGGPMTDLYNQATLPQMFGDSQMQQNFQQAGFDPNQTQELLNYLIMLSQQQGQGQAPQGDLGYLY